MTVPSARPSARLLATAGIVFCAGTAPTITAAAQAPAQAGAVTTTKAGNNPADVKFMSGMIPHHAQAVLIAGWAESHGARPDVLVLCQRIVNAQQDEIRLMQYWLREHGQPVPAAHAMHHAGMNMDGMTHDMLMPGMLNDEQLAALDKARGAGLRSALPRRR